MTTALLDTYRLEADVEVAPPAAVSDMIVRGVKVFRTGKFKNSRGVQNEWTPDMLQAAVANFNYLRSTRILPDIPVRVDHTNSMRDVVGYFHELRYEAPFLVADILFTKKTAFEEYQAGHFRGRSLEIGQYETNDEKLYDHVVQGLAFVDIPAVEGLHQRATGEETMATEQTDDKGKGKEGENGGAEKPPVTPPAENPTTPVETQPQTPPPPASPTPADQVNEHARPAVHTFRVNGTDVTDLGAVQAHIDSLEKFRSDQRTMLRNSFVDDLVRGNVITAAQKDDFTKHVGSLDDDQFTAFRTLYNGAAPSNLFGKHDTTTAPVVQTAVDAQNDLAIHRETVAQFKRMGKSEEFIKAQPAWAAIQAAEAATAK